MQYPATTAHHAPRVQRRCITRRGIAYVMALILMGVLTTLALTITHAAGIDYHKANNHRQAIAARLAAESGLQFALHTLDDLRSDPTVDDLPDMLQAVHDHLAEELPGATVTLNYATQVVGLDYDNVHVAPIDIGNGQSFSYEVLVSEYDDEHTDIASELELIVTGHAGNTTRRVAMRFDVDVDRTLLHYAMVSSVRIIARGNVRVHGPIISDWGRELMDNARNTSVYPLNIYLGEEGYITGSIGTTMSYEDFVGDSDQGDTDFHDGIDHVDPDIDMLDQMVYDEPPVMDLDVDDFDVSPLRAQTSILNLPSADSNGNRWENWGDSDHGKPALENIYVPMGTNPTFENCTFRGITFIEVDEQTTNQTSSNQNRVTFRDCTFEGPIITGVPRTMNWSHNRMDFEGATEFRSSAIQAALGGVTLMAPNYNVNIGDCVDSTDGTLDSDSSIVGLVIGGVVDLRDKVYVNGTVISMAKLYFEETGEIIMGQGTRWLTGNGVSDSNLGYYSSGSEGGGDESNNNIDLVPDPDNVMPLGIKKRYTVFAQPSSYRELND